MSEAFPPGIEVVLESQVSWVAYIKGSLSGFPGHVVFLVCSPKVGKPSKLKAMGNWRTGQGQAGSE